MANKSGTPGRARGKEFRPREPYTHRLRKILEEYPDGSQVLREILQNSDDAKSTEQVFILDRNTYPSDSVFEPELENKYQRTSLKLDRYQGPALLAKNNTIFEERDFQSLLKLADSEKRDQFDKIGVMGVGFNSIYHITDSPSFITGDNYVILDPHEWYFSGGFQFDFVGDKLAESHPDQFAPFRMPCDKLYEGTVFRYPLRTEDDSIDSNISKKIYKPDEILEMFHKFYDNESINCLLFLKYIERISFYELKQGATEPELLYAINLENADKVRENRRLIVENIVPMMNSLKLGKLEGNNQLDTSYIASFCRQTRSSKKSSSWLILNYLDDLLEAESYFHEKFKRNIGDYKFIPNVDKDLVSLVVPILESKVKNKKFLKHLEWDTFPKVENVLRQLELCYESSQLPKNLENICKAIYEYMNKTLQANDESSKKKFDIIKSQLENKSWILCKNKFYSVDKVVFRLSSRFSDNDSIIVELPYSSELKDFFKDMGVRDEIGIKDFILIIKNIVKENKKKGSSDDVMKNVIKDIVQILEQIASIQKDNRREGKKPASLEGLLIPSTENDAGAKQFSIIIDERQKFKHDPSENSLLSDEMDGWQGPALWIYNDAEFTDRDFRALIKLGVGGKTNDDTKIGRFGIGFNCAFHVTDLPSIVSGQNIAFLDPNAKFLPAQGYPPRRHRGTRFNFIDKELWKFTDQCYPYKALFECFDFMGDCSFKEAVGFGKKTLFRLPLRTSELAEISEISNRTVEVRDILHRFSNVRGIKEMLFLRNIESCSLHHINEQETRMIWQAQIHMTDACRKIRSGVTDTIQIYQLNIERI
ncbi:6774_t:CDS:2, partial [Funneliformis geosporum]